MTMQDARELADDVTYVVAKEETGFANGAAGADQEFVAPEEVELSQDEERRLRRRAVSSHRRRALRQILNSIVVVIVAASALPFWNSVAAIRAGGASSNDEATINLPGLGGWPVNMLLVIITAFVVAQCMRLAWYRREKLKDWDTIKAMAAANDPETSADGYMQIFRLYAKTKRRATYAILTGVVWFWWALAGLYVLSGEFFATATIPLTGVLVLAQAIASFVIIILGYAVGRSFLPGSILVYNTLIINFRAATSQTHYDRARQEAIRVQNEITQSRPWWFFRYSSPKD